MWTKHFRKVSPQTLLKPLSDSGQGGDKASQGISSNRSSYLPTVYAGHPNRVQRYYQYEDMDNDSDVAIALDVIADFCTQSEEQSDQPFLINFTENANDTEVGLVHTALRQWIRLNRFNSRLFDIFRNTIKNGDSFFLRDPETFEWLWMDHFMVEKIRIDDDEGREPVEYHVRGLSYTKSKKYATKMSNPSEGQTPWGSNVATSGAAGAGAATPTPFALAGNANETRGQAGAGTGQITQIDAKHVVHLSMSIGDDINYPFGASILEPVFKVFKQKELLEDSIIIYRVQRAPERRIFYIDTGSMPPVRAKAHIEAIKNEIHQRKIPNKTAGGSSILDAAYNPLAVMDDYFFAQSGEGRGSKVETLPGGELTGEIGDLLFFSKKLARGLRIPASYLSLGGDEGNMMTYSDGKLSTALIQEFIFNKYCMRLQSLLSPIFDREFKRYLENSGIQLDDDVFDLRLNPPQNFSKYRQVEIDAQRVQVYSQLADNKRLSERFKLMNYLGLSKEQLAENETMYAEENMAKLKKKGIVPQADASQDLGLSAVGLRGGSDAPMPNMDEMPDGEMDGDVPMDGSASPTPDGGQSDGGADAAAPPPQ